MSNGPGNVDKVPCMPNDTIPAAIEFEPETLQFKSNVLFNDWVMTEMMTDPLSTTFMLFIFQLFRVSSIPYKI